MCVFLDVPVKKMVVDYFTKCGFKEPDEFCEPTGDNKFKCKLDISGEFRFHSQGEELDPIY